MKEYKRLKPFAKGLFTGLVETWLPVKGYEGHYEISSFGRVKSLARMRKSARGGFAPLRERIMKPKTTKYGYLTVHLLDHGRTSWPSIHRLVADAFIPNTDNKPTVNHIDADKTNNNVSNLEWATHSEQMTHAVENDLLDFHGSPKFTKQMKLEMHEHFVKTGCSISELARLFNTSERTAGRVAKGVVPRTTTRILKDGSRFIENILTKQEVEDIKRLRSEGMTLSAIGQMFNRGTSQIHRITRNESRTTHIE
jgi:hypothetical protein